jgi:hypothetical protein
MVDDLSEGSDVVFDDEPVGWDSSFSMRGPGPARASSRLS